MGFLRGSMFEYFGFKDFFMVMNVLDFLLVEFDSRSWFCIMFYLKICELAL